MRPKFRLVGNSSLLLISGLTSTLGLLPHPHVDGYQLKETQPIEFPQVKIIQRTVYTERTKLSSSTCHFFQSNTTGLPLVVVLVKFAFFKVDKVGISLIFLTNNSRTQCKH